MVAIAQRGINGREREFVATERAVLFDRPHDLHRFTPPAHASIDPRQRPLADPTVCRVLQQFLHRGESLVKFSQLLVSLGYATERRKITGIQFKSPLV